MLWVSMIFFWKISEQIWYVFYPSRILPSTRTLDGTKKLAKDKHSSLFVDSISGKEKSF
jgi:hypothetical protein